MAWPMIAAAGIGAVGSYLGSRNQSPMQQSNQNSNSFSQFNPHSASAGMYGWLSGLGHNMMQTPTPYFPGQGYVSPSQMTQDSIAGIRGSAGSLQDVSQFAPDIAALYAGGTGDFMNAANMFRGQSPYYQQAAGMAAGQAPLYQQASDMARDATKAQQGIVDTSNRNFNFLSGAADVANNPYVQGQIKANEQSVGQQLREQWMPQINQGAEGVNALGGDRHGIMQAQGLERAAQQLSNTNASTMLNAYGQGLGAQQNALGMTQGMTGAQMAPSVGMGLAGDFMGQGAGAYGSAGNFMGQGGQALGSAGSMYGMAGNQAMQGYQAGRQGAMDQNLAAQWLGQGGQTVEGYQQMALQDQMNRFNHMYQEPWQRANNMYGLMGALQPLGTQFGGSNQQTTGNNPNYQNPWMSGLGGAAMGMGLYNQWNQYNQQQQPWRASPAAQQQMRIF